MENVSTFIEQVGRAEIAARMQVTPNAVTNAKRRGAFPKSWYFEMCGLAAEKGVSCPPSLFGFDHSLQTKRVPAPANIQPSKQKPAGATQ